MRCIVNGGRNDLGGLADDLSMPEAWWGVNHSYIVGDCMDSGYLSHEEDPE